MKQTIFKPILVDNCNNCIHYGICKNRNYLQLAVSKIEKEIQELQNEGVHIDCTFRCEDFKCDLLYTNEVGK